MIALILNFLRNHWFGTLAGVFAIGIAAKLSLEQVEISHLHKQVVECSAENNTLEQSNKALVSSVENQDAAIASLQAEANKKMKTAAHALAAAKADARKYALAAQQLRAQKNTNDECADMRSLVNNYRENAP